MYGSTVKPTVCVNFGKLTPNTSDLKPKPNNVGENSNVIRYETMPPEEEDDSTREDR